MTYSNACNETQRTNRATAATVTTLGIIFGISVFGHGFFEALQGAAPTNGLFIHAIGEANRFWELGNEPAFTLIPNFLITGIASMLVSIAIIAWSGWNLHKKSGPLVFLTLFIMSTLVGGGIGQVLFFTIAWAFSTRIHKPLTGWKKVLPSGLRPILARLWPFFLVPSSAFILYALVVAIFGWVPGISNPDAITLVMLASLGTGLVFMLAAFIAGFARDIEEGSSENGKVHSGDLWLQTRSDR